jgi:hypothetical protein
MTHEPLITDNRDRTPRESPRSTHRQEAQARSPPGGVVGTAGLEHSVEHAKQEASTSVPTAAPGETKDPCCQVSSEELAYKHEGPSETETSQQVAPDDATPFDFKAGFLAVAQRNEVLDNIVDTLTTEGNTLREALESERAVSGAEIEKWRSENALLHTRIEKLQALNDDVVPLVRDQYYVALRTLVDGVLYMAGWCGTVARGPFVLRNGRRVRALFGNQFTVGEIAALVRYVILSLQSAACTPM